MPSFEAEAEAEAEAEPGAVTATAPAQALLTHSALREPAEAGLTLSAFVLERHSIYQQVSV